MTAAPASLRGFLRPRPAPEPEPERCDLCRTAVPADHQHLLDLTGRDLRCACRPCALLFADRPRELAGATLRTVPDRYRHDLGFTLTDEQWDALQIPVGLAFFRRSSPAGGAMVASYPGPAGATESELDLDGIGGVSDARLAADLEPDVEALLVRHDGHGSVCLLVPIDACFRLVGLVRRYWKGFDGGAEAWARIDGFFDEVGSRAREVSS